jgi:hypothetical protein
LAAAFFGGAKRRVKKPGSYVGVVVGKIKTYIFTWWGWLRPKNTGPDATARKV